MIEIYKKWLIGASNVICFSLLETVAQSIDSSKSFVGIYNNKKNIVSSFKPCKSAATNLSWICSLKKAANNISIFSSAFEILSVVNMSLFKYSMLW